MWVAALPGVAGLRPLPPANRCNPSGVQNHQFRLVGAPPVDTVMPRLLVALLLALGPAVAVAAPAPKDRQPEPYSPTAEGFKRVYETRTGENVSEHTEVVTR